MFQTRGNGRFSYTKEQSYGKILTSLMRLKCLFGYYVFTSYSVQRWKYQFSLLVSMISFSPKNLAKHHEIFINYIT